MLSSRLGLPANTNTTNTSTTSVADPIRLRRRGNNKYRLSDDLEGQQLLGDDEAQTTPKLGRFSSPCDRYIPCKSFVERLLCDQCCRRLFVFFLVSFVFYTVWSMYRSISPPMYNITQLHAADSVTVLMNTFKRQDLMQNALNHYSQCNAVKEIKVIWSESDTPPIMPDSINGIKVSLDVHNSTSLNTRFLPVDISTDVILNIDDDIRVNCEDIHLSYEVWSNAPNTLVGFAPRVHSEYLEKRVNERGQAVQNIRYLYNGFWRVWWDAEYSIVLTKVAMFHKKYLNMYTYQVPKQVLAMVDERRNCEDIAFQFMVSNATGLPPLYVRGRYKDLGAVGGVSTSTPHWHLRNECLDQLVAIYGRMPLVKSHIMIGPNTWSYYLLPSSWMEYFSTDIIYNYLWFSSKK